jgi:hypothetical protein
MKLGPRAHAAVIEWPLRPLPGGKGLGLRVEGLASASAAVLGCGPPCRSRRAS